MPGPVSRRELLGMVLGRGPAPASPTARERVDPLTASIAGDFTPEMLAMEAERLGLDTGSMDRQAMLEAVMRAMQPKEEENGPSRPEV